MFVDQAVELQTVQSAEDGGHVAVGAGADDVEGLRQRDTDGSSAFQDGAECVDFGKRPMGDVGEGTVEDLAVETEGFTEEDGGRGVAVGYSGNVHVYIIQIIIHNINIYFTIYMTTKIAANPATCVKLNEFSVLSLGTSA
jgi:hypothetical protein